MSRTARILFRSRCPRCAEGNIYKSMLKVAEVCPVCGLHLPGDEQGDGPAFFAILFVSTLVGVVAALVEIKYAPPFWLQAAIWIPFIFIASIASLRIMKNALILVQYQYRPEDFGEIKPDSEA